MPENEVYIEMSQIPSRFESNREYLPQSPIMIENVFKENQKFLSNVEKIKLLDAASSEITSNESSA